MINYISLKKINCLKLRKENIKILSFLSKKFLPQLTEFVLIDLSLLKVSLVVLYFLLRIIWVETMFGIKVSLGIFDHISKNIFDG